MRLLGGELLLPSFLIEDSSDTCVDTVTSPLESELEVIVTKSVKLVPDASRGAASKISATAAVRVVG